MITTEQFNELMKLNPDDARLNADEGLFVAQDSSEQSEYERSWILDADDTLWEDNLYYEEIILEIAHRADS